MPASHGAHAGGFKYQGDTSEDYADPVESLEPRDEPVFGDEIPVPAPDPVHVRGKHGRVAAVVEEHPHLKKSRRVRKVLVVIVVLLIALICALGYYAWQLANESSRAMVQQTQAQQQSTDVGNLSQDNSGKDAASAAEQLKHGATVTSSKDVNEEGNAVKKSVTIALTTEPADTRSGTPSVYLGLNEDGKIIQAGYSAATASLGYGSLSFADAVKNEHVVEKTLRDAGVPVVDGAATLPTDKTAYSTYATDGTTLVKENCSFGGQVDINGASHDWSSVLLYDYSTANASGNLADTIRIIYIYVNA